MNDLRSLEGIGHLLSQKMAQNNKKGGLKVKKKKGHNRSASNPVMSNMSTPTPPTNTIAISAYFPANSETLVQAISNGIHVGYYQNMPSDKPNLLKSHSGFVSKDIPQIIQDDMKSNRGSTSVNEFEKVISPSQSRSPPFSPVSPNTMKQLTLENQYGQGSNNSQYGGGMQFVLGGNSNRNSMHAHFQGIPSSPSFRLGSFRGGSSLKLDLSEILLDGDSMTPRQSIPSLHFPVHTDYGTVKDNTLHNAKVDSSMSISMNGLNHDHSGASGGNSSSFGTNLSLQPNMSLPPLASPVDVEENSNEMQRRNALTSPKLLSSPLEMDPPLTKPPYPSKRTYSNQSLFTLECEDMNSTDDILGRLGDNTMDEEEKLRKNTEANANLAPDPSVFLQQISDQNSADMFSSDTDTINGSTDQLNGNNNTSDKPKRVSIGNEIKRARMSSKECDIVNIDIMNLKEDFMEYQSEQRDAFNNIGNGASGIVRKAFHFRSCKMVALKQCRSKQRHETKAFINEARIYQRFEDNENITNILGFGKDKENGNLMMAMEYMDLGSVDSLSIHSDVRLTMEMKELCVGHIILKTLYALDAVHRDRFVHNDIKPANILTNKYGEVKLSDFGTIGRLKDKGNQRLTKNCGTQRYQSPEKMIKQSISYTTKTDIWSLGVTAYELLFGDGYNAQDELAYITNTPKLSPKQHNLSAECCDFIAKCLTKDDNERPTASQLIEHKWCTDIMKIDLNEKWPWLIEIQIDDEKQKEIESAIDKLGNTPKNGKKSKNGKNKNGKKKMVSFAEIDSNNNNGNGNGKNGNGRQQHHLYNEELLFMISALIIYYATQTVDLDLDSNDQPSSMLHRRQSHINADKSQGRTYTDNERITNMAKYAHCSKEMVLDRIRATVSYIKSQINKTEKL